MTLRADNAFVESYRTAITAWRDARGVAHLWDRDATLWSATDEAKWLGWLSAPDVDDSALVALEQRMGVAAPAGVRETLLIGMGGSSLGAEVVARVLGDRAGSRTLRILDSTEPTFVRDALARTRWNETVVVVASKSGSTLEPDILMSVALSAAQTAIGHDAPRRFIAITDPGSKLAVQAAELGFADIVYGDPSVGGRYSVLSPFGLVPAALSRIGLREFIASARTMAAACRRDDVDNPGVALGAFLGHGARMGRNKCTLVLPDALASLGAWIEQLVAESTGKQGVGVIPVTDEPLGDPRVYGADRVFVEVRLHGATGDTRALDRLAAAGHPVFAIDVASVDAVAGEFFRWQFATAVAASLLAVNPFDQPDVEASKIATRDVMSAIENGQSIQARPSSETLASLLASVRPGDYVALLPFLPMFPDVASALQRTRMRIRDAKSVATSIGFGPRFLHSTGQAFKGGPDTGVFIQLTADSPQDLAIPGKTVSFGGVVAAQAAGDLQVLKDRGRRAISIHLKGPLAQALDRFDRDVTAALS